ncbi:MAG: Rab family GTPase [Promethearchaeota archaeon]
MSRRLLFKVIIVGDGGVGKSTMVQRLLTGKFIPMKITIGTDLSTYDIKINGTKVTLQIWDFAGEKRFRFFLPNYARGAYGVLLCYDITRYISFENLNEWYDITSKNAADPVFILVGCKKDLEEKRTVDQEQALKFKEEHNIDYFFETSSKSGENNKKIFETLTRSIIKKKNIPL